MTPEEKARQDIDAQLAACGWVVQDHAAVDFSAGRGIALRKLPLPTVPCRNRIKTHVTEASGKVDKGYCVDQRNQASRQVRTEVLADDLDYTPEDLDRTVVVPDQTRTILRTYRDVVQTELFPGRSLVPNIIFTKDDSHAEDIVHLCREVFGKGNDFCKKITYQARHPATGKPVKGRDLTKEFCNSTMPRTATETPKDSLPSHGRN